MDIQELEQEDFTFPTTTTSPPRFFGSPPLWHHTNSQKQETNRAAHGGKEEDFYRSKPPIIIGNKSACRSMSYIEDNCIDDEDSDQKMGMLWEHLNEEYSKNGGLLPGRDSDESPARMVRFGCIRGGGKRPSLVVFVKVLKKLFVIHNSHRSIKKSSLVN